VSVKAPCFTQKKSTLFKGFFLSKKPHHLSMKLQDFVRMGGLGSILPLLLASTGFTAEPIVVFAGVPPVAYVAERIGGERVKVEVLMQPGQDPHTYEPLPKQVRALGAARLFFKVGMPFEERLIEKISAVRKNITVVDTTAGIKKRLAAADGDHDHAEKSSPHHAAADYDPHVWLSPPNLKIQAANIAAALEKADAAHAAEYRANLKRLEDEIDAIHEKMARRLQPFAGRTMIVFHPAFGYFTDCFRLKQAAVEVGGKQPSLRQLQQLIHQAEAAKTNVVFVQPQFDPRSAQTIAQVIGGRAVPLNDMSKHVLANLEEIAEKVEQGMK
jgi:zinc transport system substrate-binding protein